MYTLQLGVETHDSYEIYISKYIFVPLILSYHSEAFKFYTVKVPTMPEQGTSASAKTSSPCGSSDAPPSPQIKVKMLLPPGKGQCLAECSKSDFHGKMSINN